MAKNKKRKGARQPNEGSSTPPPGPTGRMAVHKPFYERLLFGLALLGVLVTLHLNIWYGANAQADDPVCGIGFDCEAVLASDPMPLGVPSAVWGLLFYLAVAGLCAGILYVTDAQRVLLKKIRAGMIGFGLLYSLFLTAYQFFVLSDRCLLCLLSAAIVLVMTGVLVRYLQQPAAAARGGKRRPGLAGDVKLYGILAVALLVLAGADYAYYSSQAPPPGADGAVAGALPVASDLPVDVSQCRYDPGKQFYANMNLLVGEDDLITGNPDAPVTLMEFIDPNCPHCKTVHPTIKAITAKYPETVRVVYKPVAIVGSATHSRDEVAALYLAEEQGKLAEMLDLIFINQSPRTGLSVNQLTDFAEDLGMDAAQFRQHLTGGRFNARVRRDRDVFNGLGLRAVPTVIIEGHTVHSNSRSVGCLSHFVEQELEAKGITVGAPSGDEAAAATDTTTTTEAEAASATATDAAAASDE